MKISYSFYSLKDISNLSHGERLLEILSAYDLVIEKADNHEPIKKTFVRNDFAKMWNDGETNKNRLSCDFLFKGTKKFRFSGMATWNTNLHPNTEAFNGIDLWISVPKNYSVKELLQLGDDIFTWSDAVYGYVSEESKEPINNMIGSIYNGLPGLMWINYFGKPYIMEEDFHIPNNCTPICDGIKLVLSEKPDDDKLSNLTFLESIKREIGTEWFRNRPRGCNRRIPVFDKSQITKM